MPNNSEKDRKSRNVVFAALFTLFVIYFVKFSFPQHTVVSAFTKHDNHAQDPIPPAPVKTTSSSSSRRPTATPAPPAPAFDGPYNGTIMDKAAFIIEDRPRSNLIPLILHFNTVLGPSWPIIIYTSQENVGIFSTSAALQRHLRSGIISIRIMPLTVLFTNSDSVSSFLTKKWIWEDMAPAKHLLMFQSDSMLCSNAARSVDDFFEYDFIGAPIAEHLGEGMNGGLSLRKRETMLRILDEWDWEEDKGRGFEDRWYYDRLIELKAREEEDDGPPEGLEPINMPTVEVARTFSVETIDFPHPLGVHQVHRWMQDHLVSLDEWCPEYKLCSSEYIQV